jgi:hypothetical protein
MSNLKNEIEDIDENLDYWEIFQSETDDTRNLILDHLVKKCETHYEKDFPEFKTFEKLEEHKFFHFDNCNKYLFESERRRKPFKNGKLLYFHFPCKEFNENSKCIKGDICQLSHNQLEINFHPINYRKEMCNSFYCAKNKRYCDKSHKGQDLRYFPFSMKNSSKNNFKNKNLKNDLIQYTTKKANNVLEDKENMLKKLNFDIKNLLGELDLDNLEDDQDEDKKENVSKRIEIQFNEGKTIYKFYELYAYSYY